MRRNVTLTWSSLLSLFLLLLHVSDDVVRGIDKVGPANLIGVSIFVLWMYGALVLSDRRAGYIIMLLGSLFAAGIPVLHMFTGISRTLANKPSGALLFVFTLWALAISAAFSAVLAARGLWRREWADTRTSSATSRGSGEASATRPTEGPSG